MNKSRLRRALCVALAISLAIGCAVTSLAAPPEDYDQWQEMEGEMGVRFLVNETESTRVVVGDTFQVQFWINGIDPYSMLLPLSWDSSVVTMVNDTTGEPVESGRKQESDIGDGFRPGASCYDSSTGWDFLPLYWNGKPVYSVPEGTDGYPLVNNEEGHARFFYYVDSASASAQPQMFLELTFRAEAAGDPNFHFSVEYDDVVFDPAAEEGLTLAFTETGVITYTDEVTFPDLFILDSWEDESPGVTTPSIPSRPTTPSRPSTSPSVPSYSDSDSDEDYDEDSDPNSNANNTPSDSDTTPEPETDMVDAKHLDCFPYSAPVEMKAVVRTAEGEAIKKTDDYILPGGELVEAINKVVTGRNTALVARMPDKLIDKETYTVYFSAANLDDLALMASAMLYLETPYGFVGIEPGGLLNEVGDDAQVAVSVRPADDGLTLVVVVDGKAVYGFQSPVFRMILPYSGPSKTPIVKSSTVFGSSFESAGLQPLTISRYDEAKRAVIFITPSVGTYVIQPSQPITFKDVPDTHWAAPYISELSAIGIVSGTSADTYSPDNPVTRGQMAKMITCSLGTYQTTHNSRFTDVPRSSVFYPYVASANAVGIINGQSATIFAPDSSITRQDMIVMAYRGLSLLGLVPEPVRSAPDFTDADAIAPYAREAVIAMYRAGIIDGNTDGSFDPLGTTNRAAAAKIIGGVYRQVTGLV